MHLFKTFILIALLSLLNQSCVSAQHLQDPNAALRYMLAIGFMPELSKELTEALKDVKNEEDYQKLPLALKRKLSEAYSHRTTRLLKFAAECPDCNFMPDQSFDPSDYIPPYRTFRTFVRYLNAGAWEAITGGEHEKGAELFVSVFRFGDHCENYGPLIGWMIGLAIRNIALESMKNFLAGDYRPEAKKIISDYLKSLPRPAWNIKDGLIWEKKFTEGIFNTLSSSEEGLIELRKQISSETGESAVDETISCEANQRVLNGALEMAAMDSIKFEVHEADAIIAKLAQDKYLLKAPVCPDKGKYIFKHHIDGGADCYEVSCSCGADPSRPKKKEPQKADDKSESPAKAELRAKALEYKTSGRLEKDCKELYEYYQIMIDIDSMKEGSLAKVEELQKDFAGRNNQLIEFIAINFHKIYKQQLELQNTIDALIK